MVKSQTCVNSLVNFSDSIGEFILTAFIVGVVAGGHSGVSLYMARKERRKSVFRHKGQVLFCMNYGNGMMLLIKE